MKNVEEHVESFDNLSEDSSTNRELITKFKILVNVSLKLDKVRLCFCKRRLDLHYSYRVS